MHSRIFEVVMPVDDDFEIENYESYFDTEMVYDYYCDGGRFFDYVRDLNTEEFQDSLEWFNNSCPMFNVDGNLILNDETKAKYFQPKFEHFKKLAEEVTLEDFLDPYNLKTYELGNDLTRQDGFYMAVFNTDGDIDGIFVLDEFVRYFEGRFKIISALDYHF